MYTYAQKLKIGKYCITPLLGQLDDMVNSPCEAPYYCYGDKLGRTKIGSQ